MFKKRSCSENTDKTGFLAEESGVIIIEATLSLTAFVFSIIMILSIVNLCVAQSRISYAINTTAREISQYSYLYSLTGLNDRQSELYNAGVDGTSGAVSILSDINTVYNEIEKLGNTGLSSEDNISDILNAWDDVKTSAGKITSAGSSIESKISEIASDPKNLLFGIAKLAASETFDLVKSRLIAAPLAKTMCKRHLVDEKDGDVEAFLQHCGVVPSSSGSYLNGLDFNHSELFPYGSDVIRINVQYDVKVVALLPINVTYHFNQTAITHGWLAGEVSFDSSEKYITSDDKENDTEKNQSLWIQATVEERAELIRHMVIDEKLDEGYKKTSGLTDVQLYNPECNNFIMISSFNPLWSADDEPVKSVEDVDEAAIRLTIERLCGKMKSTTDPQKSVKTKTLKSDGSTVKEEHNCEKATNKIILVIPSDEGLKEKIERIISTSKTHGIDIEVSPSFGTGAREVKKTTESENSEN